ncbi:preprotein translocase subunit SecG [Neptuniibacter caesariensis]|uniref:Protein-export membrane protein SecG n=1 Tax=Neptuniibacter caesariensis TaxID=207954 RepID=A0A7U8C1E8_NEPCE|nr:preprotein translocase subunit SecG [Neptuniibacter caesariensis]EAR59763.1 Preprotein translocase SecG subunit [Oceanospirillum sp. MED92] [Neptuniibacter caesariensis]
METVVLIIHVLLAAAIIGLILLQQGKGAEAGASFGAGASQTVFGSTGSGNFLSRMTAIVAAGIFATSFVLAVYAKNKADTVSDAGIPSAEVIESRAAADAAAAEDQAQLPALEESKPAEVPAESDIPKAN